MFKIKNKRFNKFRFYKYGNLFPVIFHSIEACSSFVEAVKVLKIQLYSFNV